MKLKSLREVIKEFDDDAEIVFNNYGCFIIDGPKIIQIENDNRNKELIEPIRYRHQIE